MIDMCRSNHIISIIIPVFNTEDAYLRRCLSPFMENFDSRIEIIVVDDGSDVITANKLIDYQKKCSNHMLLLRHDNQGQNGARSFGIKHATGKYIEFLDSDDYIDWRQQCYLLDLLEKNSPDILAINATIVDDNGVPLSDYAMTHQEYGTVPRKSLLVQSGALWRQVYNREFYNHAGYDLITNVRIGEDLASVVPLYVDACTVYAADIDLYRYVHRETSMVNTPDPKRIMDITDAFDVILDRVSSKEYFNEIEWLAIKHVLCFGISRAISWCGPQSSFIKELEHYCTKHFPKWRNNPYLKKDAYASSLQCHLILGRHYYIYSMLLHIKQLLSTLKSKKH